MNDEIIPLEDDIYEEEIEVEEETAVMNAMWGNISGNIANQTDLQQALDAKQDNLTQAQLDAVNSGITSAKVATYDGYPAQITSAVSSEADIRRQADTTLQSNIDAEERARKAADKDIQDVLDGETLARQNADNALGGRIDTEIHDRQVADNGLQSQIDAITSKSDVVDVVANYAALQAYDTSTLGNNDVVKVLDDETHGDAMTYYRWSTTTQTWSYIGQEAPYYTKSQTDTILLGKQDKIDATHKLSADLVDDTSTTNKFVTAQDKTNWNAKQDALTAGNNIDITGTTISTPAIVPEVVAELPSTGTEGKLYLTPKSYTTGTATGNPITISLGEDAGQITSAQLDGDTYQQSYTGKNLYNYNDVNYVAPDVFTVDDDGWITCTLNTAPTSAFREVQYYTNNLNLQTSTQYAVVLEVQNISISGSGSGYVAPFSSWIGHQEGQFTTEKQVFFNELQAGGVYVYKPTTRASYDYLVGLRTYVRFTTGQTGTITFRLSVVADTTTTASTFSYEPYVGGVPSPNPDYPQQIQTVTGEQTVEVVGKNKIDPTILQNAWNNNDGVSIVYSQQYVRTVEYTPVDASTTYTMSYLVRGSVVMRGNILQYDSNKTFISSISIANNITFTTTSSTAFVRFNLYHPDNIAPNDVTNLQLELGSQASSYTPYSKQTLPISLGSIELCKLGDYQDYIYKDGNDWKVHKATAKVIFDGSEGWSQSSTTNQNREVGYINSVSLGIKIGSPRELALMTSFIYRSSDYTYGGSFRLFNESQGVIQYVAIAISKKTVSDITEFVKWLEDNNQSFYYVVNTPTDTTITDQTLIAQLEAVRNATLQSSNTITNTATGSNLAGDMEVGYYGYNPTDRYDKWLWLDLNNNYEQIGS